MNSGRSAQIAPFPGFRTRILTLVPVMALLAVAPPLRASTFWSFYDPRTTHRAELGDWQLKIERNRFSGEIACRLRSRNRRIEYVGNALGFRFGKHIDTASASYRLDDGPVRRWRDDLPELVAQGSPIDGPGLDNPTGGIVWLPAVVLRDINRITIQAQPDRRSKSFHLRGFAGLLTIAQARGCTPDARFVR